MHKNKPVGQAARDRRPLIVGSGLCGMALSRVLSNAGIPHRLLGRAPRPTPRPGESLDLVGTVLARQLFGELAHHLAPKEYVVTILGDYQFDCPLEITPRGPARWLLPTLGFRPPPRLDHVNRATFDVAVHRLVTTSPHCDVHSGWVASIEADASGDRISAVHLTDGTILHPTFVFDASGPAAVVGRALALEFQQHGPPQRSLLAHLRPDPGLDPSGRWRHGTSLLRLYGDSDGVDAGSWCIPIGDAVSVGASRAVDAASDLADEVLLERAVAGWRRRGYPLPDPERPRLALNHRYGRFRRGWGGNWLLCGPSHGAIWWPSSTGVGHSLAAATGAVEALRSPERVGKLLEQYMSELTGTHKRLDGFMHPSPRPASAEDFTARALPLVRANLVRLTICSRIGRRSRPTAFASRVIDNLVGRRGLGRTRCRTHTVPDRPR